MIEQTETEQADLVLKTTIGTAAPETAQEAAAPLGKPAAAMQPEIAAGVEPLVRARQALGLGASDIAAKLGMATRQIEALERGDWQALPGQAFVRGALRSYGKAVGVDVAPLLASIGGQVAAPELRSSSSLDAAMPHRGTLGFGSSGSGGRLVWIVLGVAAVIAMALYFGDAFEIGRSGNGEQASAVDGSAARSTVTPLTGVGGTAASGSATPGTARPGVTTPGVTTPGSSSSLPAAGAASGTGAAGAAASGGGFAQLAPLTPLIPLAPAPVAAEVGGSAALADSQLAGATRPSAAADASLTAAAAGATVQSGPAAGAEPRNAAADAPSSTAVAAAASESPPAAAAASDRLRFQFARESWVDIRDGGGKVLLQGTQSAGSSRELSGAAPFRLVIGNAGHVSLERNGSRVDLRNRTRSGVARLTLD